MKQNISAEETARKILEGVHGFSAEDIQAFFTQLSSHEETAGLMDIEIMQSCIVDADVSLYCAGNGNRFTVHFTDRETYRVRLLGKTLLAGIGGNGPAEDTLLKTIGERLLGDWVFGIDFMDLVIPVNTYFVRKDSDGKIIIKDYAPYKFRHANSGLLPTLFRLIKAGPDRLLMYYDETFVMQISLSGTGPEQMVTVEIY